MSDMDEPYSGKFSKEVRDAWLGRNASFHPEIISPSASLLEAVDSIWPSVKGDTVRFRDKARKVFIDIQRHCVGSDHAISKIEAAMDEAYKEGLSSNFGEMRISRTIGLLTMRNLDFALTVYCDHGYRSVEGVEYFQITSVNEEGKEHFQGEMAYLASENMVWCCLGKDVETLTAYSLIEAINQINDAHRVRSYVSVE
jgi:rhodanese-related sulfurtransferase